MLTTYPALAALASWRWRVTVVISCLAFIALTIWLGPFIRTWPWSVRVVVGVLEWIAMLVGGLTLVYDIAQGLARLVIETLEGRTNQAKVKFADSLMTISTAVHSALVIGLLVVPFTAFMQTLLNGTDPMALLHSRMLSGRFSYWHAGLMFVLLLAPVAWARACQRRAFDIYDEISTTQETHEPQRIGGETPTAHTSANGASRRRRRHRTR